MSGAFAEAVKYLALDLPKAACKVLWNSKARTDIKDILMSSMDLEMQKFCSSKNPSLLRESNGKELLKFSLEEFDKELRSRAPLTNDLLDILCTSARQKKEKRSHDGESSQAKKISAVRQTVASMILNCRCPELSALACRVGLIVRHSGAGRSVSHLPAYLLQLF